MLLDFFENDTNSLFTLVILYLIKTSIYNKHYIFKKFINKFKIFVVMNFQQILYLKYILVLKIDFYLSFLNYFSLLFLCILLCHLHNVILINLHFN